MNEIVVNEDGVTGFHANNMVKAGQLILTDIGGSIIVNADALSGPTLLRMNNSIVI